MSADDPGAASTGLKLVLHTDPNPRPPEWFPELLILAQWWRESGLLERLQQTVRVKRGRAGLYEVCDFALLLLGYAVSGERTLAEFFTTLQPFAQVLAGAWERKECASASSLSRFLDDVDEETLCQERQLFETDLCEQGLPVELQTGLYDRTGKRFIVFDMDGTVQAARQRRLINSPEYPPLRRRRQKACRPGYHGRKRGEVQRNRSTLCQAHTREWLGTYAAPGNGKSFEDLALGMKVVHRYMSHHGLDVEQALVRLDGLYGTSKGVKILQASNVSFVVRGRDYEWLKHPLVEATLTQEVVQHWQQAESERIYDLFDVGFVADPQRNYEQPVRLVVMRSPRTLKRKPKVGKCRGEWVYELFFTGHSQAGLSARDIVDLYHGRGGFEKTLGDEDIEQNCDRWCSADPDGQSFWQILSQWVWNWRLRLGWQHLSPEHPRQTLWADAITTPMLAPVTLELPHSMDTVGQSEVDLAQADTRVPLPPEPVPLSAHAGTIENFPEEVEYGPMTISSFYDPKHPKLSGDDFTLVDEHTVTCPAGHAMPRRSRYQCRRTGDWILLFIMPAKICQACPMKTNCLHDWSTGKCGRRITVRRKRLSHTPFLPLPEPIKNPQLPEPAPPPECISLQPEIPRVPPPIVPLGQEPVWWVDVPSTQLRRSIIRLFKTHQVKIEVAPRVTPSATGKKNLHSK